MELAVKCAQELRKKYEVNVASIPSIEVFEKQPAQYKAKVISKDASLVLAIEASNDTKWLKILGKNGATFAIEEYGKSGDGVEVMEKAGYTVKNIVKYVEAKLKAQK